jgi:cardiolipin synthase
MPVTLSLESAQTVVLVAFIAYAISVGIFLILENRSPQSTFAWLLLFLSFPIGGVVFYLLVGRGWRAFSQQKKLTPLIEGTKLGARANRVLEEQPVRIDSLAEGRPDSSPRLARMLWATANAPLSTAASVEILQNAREKYPRLLADIDRATHSIHMVYYEWADDAFTRDVAKRLAERVKAGVKVRILYDPVGSFFMMNRGYLNDLRAAGVEIWSYSPVYYLHSISYRNHRKIAVIDGRIGYTGGLNMTEKHLTGPAGFSGWRDTHVRLTGEAVLALQGVFATMWLNTTDEAIVDGEYFPHDETLPAHGTPVQVVSAGPDSRWEAIRQSYLAMIAMARHHVYIQSPFLILDTSLAEVMKTAALSGVQVWVMIAPRGGEGQLAYRAGMTYARDMEDAGVRVLLYQGAYFHSKTICVDSTICSVGSANMDIRSFTINYETNLVVHDATVTRRLEADFLDDMRRCTEFLPEDYDRLHWWVRLEDSVMRLCSPLL